MREGKRESAFAYNQSICTCRISRFLLKYIFFPKEDILLIMKNIFFEKKL